MSIDLFTVIIKGLSAIARNAQETSPFTQSYDLIVDGVTDSLQRLEVGGYSYSIERHFKKRQESAIVSSTKRTF